VTTTATDIVSSELVKTVTSSTSDVVNQVTTKLVSDPALSITKNIDIPVATASPDAIVNSIKTKIPGLG
jgi:hypothetical protein